MAAVTVEQALRVAGEHRRGGRWGEAEGIYRQVLGVEPGNAEAYYGLGLLAGQAGRWEVAVEMLEKAAALHPQDAGLWSNLGEFYRRLGKLESGVEALRRSLRIKEDNALAHFNLGVALGDQGKVEEAMGAYQRAMALDGGRAEFYVNYGGLLEKQNRDEEAVAAYEAALRIMPGLAWGRHNLANVFRKLGRREEAKAGYRRVMELEPGCAEAYDSLGMMLGEEGKAEEGEGLVRRALEIKPEQHEFCNNLAALLGLQGRAEEALSSYWRAIRLRPGYAAGYYNLGTFLMELERWDEALEMLGRAVELNGDLADGVGSGGERTAAALAENNLGCALLKMGLVEEAMGHFERAMEIEPGQAEYETNRLLGMQYRAGFGEEEIFEAGRRWDERHGAKGREEWGRYANERDPGRRLRVGYVSGDFRMHSVAFFLIRLLEERDRAGFHVTCYYNHVKGDGVTERFRRAADEWREIAMWTDAEAARRIREDRIDILVDLTGHTAGSRLGIFVRKPAPVQVAYLGYPGTTGVAAMDYRLSDGWADPVAVVSGQGSVASEGAGDAYSTETVWRLGRTAWCFEPLSGSPEVGELPALAGGVVTLGTFNHMAKVTEEMMGAWAEILRRVAGSRLLLKNAAMGHAGAAGRVRAFFAKRGVGAERLELVGTKKENLEHLREYGRVDVGLDTFPYHGTTTTCEALWMGVPVVTLAGRRHASRVGVSLLANVGMGELVAGSVEEYVGIAAGLAGDLGKLAELRKGLRERMRGSALMDGKGAAREVEGAFREMWGRWVAT